MEKQAVPHLLMVCLGNICRSPMAEGIMRQVAEDQGVEIVLDSAGTGHWHVGEPPDDRAIRTMASLGMDISGLRARQFTQKDFDRFTHIFVMDASNYQDVMRLARHERDQEKVQFLTQAAWPGENRTVPDPWFGKEEGFASVAQLIHTSCLAILQQLKHP
jgi:protein-tyrosine phosphatase